MSQDNQLQNAVLAKLACEPGVIAAHITDEITIHPSESSGDSSDVITHALHRSWLFHPTLVTVTARDGAVRPHGTVGTSRERQIAAETAWAARDTFPSRTTS